MSRLLREPSICYHIASEVADHIDTIITTSDSEKALAEIFKYCVEIYKTTCSSEKILRVILSPNQAHKNADNEDTSSPVSYTHLTLPTTVIV